jgi:predicted aminopeptidase
MADAMTETPGVRRARWPRMVRRVGAGLAVVAIALLALTPTGCYLSRAGWEEAKILRARRPIAEVVRDDRVDATTRGKLSLVLVARQFAADSIGLEAKESFTQFTRLDHDTLVLVLSGARRDRLQPHTWWFPIVGRVPYKGYFDFDAARSAARELEGRGLDVYLRPSTAFSTLGFFNDPLLSTVLSDDSVGLANTVIHELTHNTFYAPGQAVFNESFANFVGARGSAWLFRSRGGGRSAAVADSAWADEKRLGAFWSAVYASLDSAYGAHDADSAARIVARDSVYARARRTLVNDVGPLLTTYPADYATRVRLDNAALLARRIYLTDLGVFDAVWTREGHDLRRTIARVIALAKSKPKDPFAAVRAWLAAPGA